MKMLILGESGSMGAGLPDPELAWGRILQREITERTGEAPEIVHTRFYTWTLDWEDFLLKTLAKGPFDLVVLSPAKFGFQVYSADNRIRKLLGKRTGDWFKGQADGFDAKTRRRGDEGPRRKLNRLAHRTVRRVVGQSPLSNVETITESYIRTMAHLARLEDTQVVVLISTHPSAIIARRRPVVLEQVVRFRAAMKAEAERRRFDWIDREALWHENDGDRNQMFSDGVHKTAPVHIRLADAILGKISGQLGRAPARGTGPVKLLILGESDSLGLAMPDRSNGWGNLLAAQLPALVSEPVETEHVRFYSWGSNSAAYLDSILERGPFDAIVISATKGGFTIFSAYNRVRRLFGGRAGDWFQHQADAYDRRARWRKPPGIKKSLNRFAHRVAQRVIGQEPPTTPEVVAEGYVLAFARLARLEDAHVVVVVAPGLPGFTVKRRPKLAVKVEQFRSAIRSEANRRRFVFVDPETLVPPSGPERDAMFIDDLHKSLDYQALVGSAVAQAVAAVWGDPAQPRAARARVAPVLK